MNSTHCISQLAGLIKTILIRCVERSVYCKFIVLLFLLGALNGSRGSTGPQDSGSDVGHLWFVVRIWAKWSYKTIVAAWVHYNKQYNILKKSSYSPNSRRVKIQVPSNFCIWKVQWVVYNHWTGGLLLIIFVIPNQTHSPIVVHMSPKTQPSPCTDRYHTIYLPTH